MGFDFAFLGFDIIYKANLIKRYKVFFTISLTVKKPFIANMMLLITGDSIDAKNGLKLEFKRFLVLFSLKSDSATQYKATPWF